jgi:hypothetical protein
MRDVRGPAVSRNRLAKDSATARATLDELCAKDVLEACAELASVILPSGTPVDRSRARELLTRTCDRKHAQACEFLKVHAAIPGLSFGARGVGKTTARCPSPPTHRRV